ncbi:MAG: universal stress protein [Cyanobacteria bacterium J06621_8]
MLNKILYADSGAKNAQDMLKILGELPAAKKVKVSVLKVISPQLTPEEAEAQKTNIQGEMNELLARLDIKGAQASYRVEQGDPKTTVLQVAQEEDVELIVMGSRGLGKLQSILSNSVSKYLFQLSDRSMLLVKDDIHVKRLKRVMVAIDRSAAASYALDLTLSLLEDYSDAEIFLIRVNPDLDPKLKLSREEMENNPILIPAIAKVKSKGLKYRCLVTGGRPAKMICNLAEARNIDLVVLGSPERNPSVAQSLTDLDRLLGSSFSDYIRIKAPCPVLMARPQARS